MTGRCQIKNSLVSNPAADCEARAKAIPVGIAIDIVALSSPPIMQHDGASTRYAVVALGIRRISVVCEEELVAAVVVYDGQLRPVGGPFVQPQSGAQGRSLGSRRPGADVYGL